MDPLTLLAVIALSSPPAKVEPIDIDAPLKAQRAELDSPELNANIYAAMAMPYKWGVTQMPCKAKEWQPARHWYPAREPSGKIQWVVGPKTKVIWSGIYGTCFIQSPLARDKLGTVQRTALECECNGWLPKR